MSEWVLSSGNSPTSMTRVFLGVDTGYDPSFHDWLLALPQGMVQKCRTRRKSPSRLMVRTSTSAPWPMCSCLMAPMSITHSSKMAGAGGIGSIRGGYGAERVGEGSTKGEGRTVGRPAADAAVGVEEEVGECGGDRLSEIV